jgi:hypothetical protein
MAEGTRRSKRSVRLPGGGLKVVPRSAMANSAEAAAFMAGEKCLLLFIDAGGTGQSYHAAPGTGAADRIRVVEGADLWTCPKSGSITRTVALET